jgi:hypothetical protein
MIAKLASTRRVQTELLIHHPINANNQPLDEKASSFISRFQVDSTASVALESHASEPQAKSEVTHTSNEENEKRTTMWQWLSSGGPLTSLSLALSSHVLGHTGGKAKSMDALDRRMYICSLAIFFLASFACTCRIVEWLKSRSRNKRNQYIHRSRVIYEWIQTPNSVTFFTKLPPGQTQDSLEVKLWPNHARMGRKDKVPFLKEALYAAIDVEKCSWSVTWTGDLVITLAKEVDQEWPCVFSAHHPDRTVYERVRSDQPQRAQKVRLNGSGLK